MILRPLNWKPRFVARRYSFEDRLLKTPLLKQRFSGICFPARPYVSGGFARLYGVPMALKMAATIKA